MRVAVSCVLGALGLALCAVSARAAPTIPNPDPKQGSNIVQAWAGCGWGFHPNRWGYCAPNRYSYYRSRPYWGGGYYGGYGGGYYRPWGSPSDHVASELNRRELWRGGGYGWGY